ncbi:MAG: inositol monophosphatase family protein [Pseudomonadota bacterium]
MTDEEFEALVETAHALADAARGPILTHFRSDTLTADNKLQAGFDPVTVADREAELAMRAVLAAMRPDDGIFGEEQGRNEGSTGLIWVLDPIDGTRAFIAGAPVFGVLIGLFYGTRPILGVVDQPYIGERFVGALAGGSPGADLLRGNEARSIHTRRGVALKDATILSTFPEVGRDQDRLGFEAVRDQAQLTRYGLDCYGYMLVAIGQADLVIEAGLNAYDIQGPMAVVEAAGGVVTNWRGGPCHEGGQVIAAGSREIHEEALALLAPYADPA